MNDTSDELLTAVDSGDARRLGLEELNGQEYFAHRAGRVYSLNSEAPRLLEPTPNNDGLESVVLMTRDGWRRYAVGDLIAEAFICELRPGPSAEYTVAYLDGDTRNNAASNLRWVTKGEAKRLRAEAARGRHGAIADAGGRRPVPAAAQPAAEADRSAVREATGTESREMLKLLERSRRTEERLDALTREHQRLLTALTPFAEFAETPEIRVGHPDATVLEANKGRPTYRRVTVGDLRRALDVMREALPERR
jgi:hypothetical protein